MKKPLLTILLCLILTTSAFGQWSGVKPMLGEQINRAHQLGDFVAAWFMQEGSGSKVFDLSGSGYNGTFVNTPVWVPGDSGPAIDFESGDSDYINCGTGFQITNALTVIARIKPETIAGYPTIIGKWVPTGDEKQWKLTAALNGGNPYIDLSGTGGDDIYRQGTAALATGVWVTLAGVYDGTTLHFYKNGILDDGTLTGVVPASLYQSTGNVEIGRQGDNSLFFDGVISYILVYNRVLNPSEIALLYREPFCMFEQDDIALMATAAAPPPSGGQVIFINTAAISLSLIFAFVVLKKKKKTL